MSGSATGIEKETHLGGVIMGWDWATRNKSFILMMTRGTNGWVSGCRWLGWEETWVVVDTLWFVVWAEG